ncbi:hypothetical protein [Streptomyces sp. NBC_01244]|uniref:hypothetical protein n=1 Tax=Streptomyces sp. NBC_01244 TaxID=2903797 RepID=UPI002E0EE684|nr:hypothetical protein OG247_44495 [Streptomyces sp. NBC_01244]
MYLLRRHRPRRLATMAMAVATASTLATSCSDVHPSDQPPAVSSPAPDGPSAISSPSPHPVDPSLFAGEWSGHGRYLTIAQDGSFEAGGRTYYNCAEENRTPCDTWAADGEITSGLHATGRLISGEGTNATGEVAESNDLKWLPKGAVTVTLNPAIDSVYFGGILYCGPKAPPGVC